MWKEGTAPARVDPVAPGDAAKPAEERRAAWVGKALRIEGRIVSSDHLTIDGEVDGTIEVGDKSLTIGPGATVRADLVARVITISGTVTGNVQASEKLDLRATGSVTGDIVTARLSMADGALITGKVEANKHKA